MSKLLNITELSEELGVNRAYLTAAKRHGFNMPGGRSTVKLYLAWHKTAKDFRITTVRPNASSRGGATSYTPHAQRQKRGQHTA